MPRLVHRFPKRCHHRASGQDVVTLDGRDFYLGPHNSKIAKAEYERLVGEWLQGGRRLPARMTGQVDYTITEIIDRYRVFAERYFVKNGEPTCLSTIKATMKALRLSAVFGRTIQPATFDKQLSRDRRRFAHL